MWGTIFSIVPILLFQIARRFVLLPEDTVLDRTHDITARAHPAELWPLGCSLSSDGCRCRRAPGARLRDDDSRDRDDDRSGRSGLVFLAVGNNLSTTEITLRALIAIIAMAAIVMLSEPLKNFLQERADRFFYGERYDLRQGLLDFGRTLSATTALDPLLDGLNDRLKQVLDVEKVAVFIEDERTEITSSRSRPA